MHPTVYDLVFSASRWSHIMRLCGRCFGEDDGSSSSGGSSSEDDDDDGSSSGDG